MYCLQWLIPVLLISKPTNPVHLQNQLVFVVLYVISCFLERKPCMICLVLFVVTTFILCLPNMESSLFSRLYHNNDLVCS